MAHVQEPRTARDVIGGIIAVGALLLVVGGIIAVLTWPTETITPGEINDFGSQLRDKVTESGNGRVALIGSVLAGIGLMLLNVGLLAWAVSLGVRAADNR